MRGAAASRFLQFLVEAAEALREQDWAEIRAGEAAIVRYSPAPAPL